MSDVSNGDRPSILIIEDYPEIRESIVHIIRSSFKLNIFEAGSLNEALLIIKKKPELICVFSDYDLGDGNAYEVYKNLQVNHYSLPFILCTASLPQDRKFTEKDKLSSVISKPFRAHDIIEAIKNATHLNTLGPKQASEIHYSAIHIQDLVKIGKLNTDIFIKLSDRKFVRILPKGSLFGTQDFEHYKKRGVESLHFNSKEIGAFIDSYTKELVQLATAKSLPPAQAIQVSSNAHETLHHMVSELGVSPEIMELAQACTQLAITTVSNEPSLSPLLDQFKSNPNHYLSTHSVHLAQISCSIATQFGWTSEPVLYKLALAAILHDLSIPTEELALLELLFGQKKQATPEAEEKFKQLRTHGNQSVLLLSGLQSIPFEVTFIIQCHHERPDGEGFPLGLDANQVDDLSATFIIAHDLVNYLWMQGKGANLKAFAEFFGPTYRSGVFLKFIEKILKKA